MKATLFPEMEREILSDRLAARRETVQRCREFLRGKDGHQRWIRVLLAQEGSLSGRQIVLLTCELSETDIFKDAIGVLEVATCMAKVGMLRSCWKTNPMGEKDLIFALPK